MKKYTKMATSYIPTPYGRIVVKSKAIEAFEEYYPGLAEEEPAARVKRELGLALTEKYELARVSAVTDGKAFVTARNAEIVKMNDKLVTFFQTEVGRYISNGYPDNKAREMAKKKTQIRKQELLMDINEIFPEDLNKKVEDRLMSKN